LTVRFKRESDAFYLEAKRSVVATTARVPYWVLLLLVVLGWNEFVTIVTSPLYLVFFSVVGFFGYIIWLLNLFGPVESFCRMIVAEILKIGTDKLRSGLQQGGPHGEKLGQYLSGETKKEQ